MPQEFRAVQCFSCNTFQVDIVKKVGKWTCKICQKNQSIKTEFSRGTAKDCRLVVQQLNEKLHTSRENDANEEQENQIETLNSQYSKRSHTEVDQSSDEEDSGVKQPKYNNEWIRSLKPEHEIHKAPDQTQSQGSKWSKFQD